MSDKIVYNYDADTKIYIGSEVCRISPLDGMVLIPANCSEITPKIVDGYIPVFEDCTWVNKENNIGKFRVVDNQAKEIKELGNFNFILTDEQLTEIHSGKLVKIEKNKIVIYEREKTTEEKIIELESQITLRRMREAVLGNQESLTFIDDIEKQIKKLREVI